ncbi:MAG: fatty acid desaturase family protein [Bacteroidales bacterium]
MTAQRIKFSPKYKPEFITELRKEVQEYFKSNRISKAGNSSVIPKAGFMIMLYLLPFALMMTGIITSLPLILTGWLLMGAGMAGIGMVLMHDANHGALSENQKLNKLMGKSLYFLGGFPATWKYQHNTLHHGFTNIEGHDEDIDPVGILRLSPHKPVYRINRYQQWYAWFLYGLMTLTWITSKDFQQLIRYHRENAPLDGHNKFGRLMTDLIVSKFLYYAIFLIAPIILLPIAWYWTVLFFVAMHFTAGLILGAVFQTAHVMPTSEYPLPDEDGNMDNNWAIHQMQTTTNFAPDNRLLTWLIGGLNFQVEHHLFPNISHVHYKKLSPMVKAAALKYGVPYHVQPNFRSALYNHFKMLKNLGREGEKAATGNNINNAVVAKHSMKTPAV